MSMSSWGVVISGLSAEQCKMIVDETVSSLSTKSGSGGLTLEENTKLDILRAKVESAVPAVTARLQLTPTQEQVADIVDTVVGQLTGFTFLMPVFKDPTVSEAMINPDGSLWVMRKGEHFEDLVASNLSRSDMGRCIEALLRPIGRAISEAVPSAFSKINRTKSYYTLRGGARVQILHPIIAPGDDFPSVNIRFYEPEPVKPERLLQWNVAPEFVIRKLMEFVGRKARLLICGGTATGKTTFLSAICNGIPKEARVVKIEDPQEIWITHANQVTIEARPIVPGMTGVPVTLRDGVDMAMRMSPNWLILGEVRTGDAAMSLFRAQMSDHPGLSTFHAENPDSAIERLCTLVSMDMKIDSGATMRTFVHAVDLLVQIGYHNDKRCLMGVWEVERQLVDGRVAFRKLYEVGDTSIGEMTRRR